MGGGSSNAAAALIGINKLLDFKANRQELMEIGSKLGADVPFFLFGGAALASGIGNKLKRINFPLRLWFLLVNPGFPISTAWAYQNLRRKLTKKTNDNINIPDKVNQVSEITKLFSNDLEEVVIHKYPDVKKIKDELLENGAKGALMTGSGPTVFGVFEDEEKARRAFPRLSYYSRRTLFLAHSL